MGSDEKFSELFDRISQFGALPGGGVDRQAGTIADGQQRDYLVRWLSERGFTIRIDHIGNLFALYEWNPGAPYVAIGSHLDSQPNGGRFDGAYGVVAGAWAAAEIASQLDNAPYNLAVVCWFNEEGSRFTPSMMGSAVFVGSMPVSDALAIRDRGGVSVEESLEAIGYHGSDEGPSLAAYVEIHVEQGRILEDTGVSIGLVESTWAARKYQVLITGEQSHTGSTVMSDRRDALAAAAAFILDARTVALDSRGALHTAVSEMTVEPNSPVVVASHVSMNCDLRSEDFDTIVRADEWLTQRASAIEESFGVRVQRRLTHQWEPQPYHQWGVALAERCAQQLGLSSMRMRTIAGHDSTNLKDHVPTVMLFVPSAGGVAHNVGEFTSEADCLAGAHLVKSVLLTILNQGVPGVEIER